METDIQVLLELIDDLVAFIEEGDDGLEEQWAVLTDRVRQAKIREEDG